MRKVTALTIENKNKPIIVYKHQSKDMHKNIEDVLTKFDAIELGSVKSKFYEEYFYTNPRENWEIYVNISMSNKYQISYGEKKYYNITAFVLLMNFNNMQQRSSIYKNLLEMGDRKFDEFKGSQGKDTDNNQNLNI